MPSPVPAHLLPAGYVWQEYPKHRHHAVHKYREVKNKAEEERLTPDEEGWVDDLLELDAQKTVSTDSAPRYAAQAPKRSHHKKVATPAALSTD